MCLPLLYHKLLQNQFKKEGWFAFLEISELIIICDHSEASNYPAQFLVTLELDLRRERVDTGWLRLQPLVARMAESIMEKSNEGNDVDEKKEPATAAAMNGLWH